MKTRPQNSWQGRRATFVAIVGISVLSGLFQGCGSGDSSSTDTNGSSVAVVSLSRAEYLQQANKICKKATLEISSQLEKAVSDGSNGVQIVGTVTVPGTRQAVDALADLGAPKQNADEVAAMIKAFEDGLKALEEDPVAGIKSNPLKDGADKAASIGLSQCAYLG